MYCTGGTECLYVLLLGDQDGQWLPGACSDQSQEHEGWLSGDAMPAFLSFSFLPHHQTCYKLFVGLCVCDGSLVV